MNESYDIPSEPLLSNTLHLTRATPRSRSKTRQSKRRPPPTPVDPSTEPSLGLDDTVPLDGKRDLKIDFDKDFIDEGQTVV